MISVKIEETAGLKMGTIWFRVLISGDSFGVLEEGKKLRDVLKKVLEPIGVRVNGVAGKGKDYFFIVDCPSYKRDKVRRAIEEIVEAQTLTFARLSAKM